ncbi:ABC transporter substrate-binding protein [Micromonospora zingiberis]|uniref:ABC transporter substrate-binding protein n=1 Tax=Micromonospora zingiberis TaxID=2053011 RepID=A0A4R0GMV9_9ACTN|nr:ABC transporter substrate-binding protein [Micromonospora zingiberis]TCB96841.1 ABC transporter substrate-binding protein [Micromonospora zingiberis]
MPRTRTSTTLLALALTVVTAAAGCGRSAATASGQQVTELRYQGSVGAVTLPELAEDLGYLDGVKLKWIGNTISGPQDIQAATTGDTEFGGAFNGAIVKLAAANAPITAVIGYYGSNEVTYQGFYVLEDSPIRTARDLIGKRIGVNTLGAHAEAVVKTYLARNGLNDDEIKQVELVVVPPVNTEQGLRQRQIDVAGLGGTLRDRALERGGVRPIFTDHELLGTFTAGSYVFRDDFIKANPDTVRTFVSGVAKAIEWSRSQPREEVIARFEDILRKRARNEDNSQLQFWRSYGVAGSGGVIADSEFATWVDWLSREGELRGKKVSSADIYSNEFNPYRAGGELS